MSPFLQFTRMNSSAVSFSSEICVQKLCVGSQSPYVLGLKALCPCIWLSYSSMIMHNPDERSTLGVKDTCNSGLKVPPSKMLKSVVAVAFWLQAVPGLAADAAHCSA